MSDAGLSDHGKSSALAQGAGSLYNNSLYISDLDKDVSEPQIYAIFSKVGPLASVRVCRDAVTGQSLGYGYVNYDVSLDPGAAERALEELNYMELAGRPLRVMRSCRNPALRASGKGNVCIKNLDRSIGHKALHEAFSSFGRILSCKVATDKEGRSKGYGYVHFEEEAAAKLAISKVKQLNGVRVLVEPYVRAEERQNQPEREAKPFQPERGSTNVYVKNIASSMSEDDLRLLFSTFGTINSVVIIKDDAGFSKGFGFVDFLNPRNAALAIDTLGGTLWAGKKLFCSPAQKKSDRQAELNQKMGFKPKPNVWVRSPNASPPTPPPPCSPSPVQNNSSEVPIATLQNPAGSQSGNENTPENCNPHPSLDALPLDLMELLNLSPEPSNPVAAPKNSNAEHPLEPAIPFGSPRAETSLANPPRKPESPTKQNSPFQTSTPVLGGSVKPGPRAGAPNPTRSQSQHLVGSVAPPNSPSEVQNSFSLFHHDSLHSVSSAKIPAEYLREHSNGLEKEAASVPAESALTVAKEGKEAAEKLEKAVKQHEEFSFPTLNPMHPAASWA